ncbi:MAG: zinc-binding dehydrogenase [Actinomycetota bacterium]
MEVSPIRAWLLHDVTGPEAYALGDVPSPEPGPHDVRVTLRASALNHLDLWVARGLPRPPSLPHVGGADGAGVIDAVGTEVTGIAPGDEVVIDPSTSCGACAACVRGEIPFCARFEIVGEHRWGTHAETVVVPAVNVVPKPERLDWAGAAAFGLVTSSALRMLRRARLRSGDRALVIGVGGGTSTASFQLARALGADVFVTSTKHDKLAWALEHGAAGGFDSSGEFDRAVLQATDGRGVDIVVDNVGPATFERSMRSLARGGRLVTNGSTSGRTAELHLPMLFWRQLEVIGATMNDHREFTDAVGMVARGEVDPVPVDSRFAFEDFPAALARLDAGDQLGKIVLER